MDVSRTFYNTGQALFVVERLNLNGARYTIVYDCGNNATDSKGTRIKKKIELAFDKNEEVDALYISHYDSDHINGVEYLLNYCTVKHVFLPMLNLGQELWFNIDYSTNSIIHQIYYHEGNTFQQGEMNFKIHRVSILNQEEPQELIDTRADGFDGLEGDVNSGTSVRLHENGDEPDWVYVTHNVINWDTNIWTGFMLLLRLPKNSTPKDVVTRWRSGGVSCSNLKKAFIDAIKAAGVKVSKESEFINEHSMTLYSGPIGNNDESESRDFHVCIHLRTHNKKLFNCECIIGSCKIGCLYLGDYNAQKNSLSIMNVYKKFWHNIGLIQIPHHGSKNNFSCEIIIKGGLHIIPIERRSGQVNPTFVEDEIKQQGEFVKLVDQDLEIHIS